MGGYTQPASTIGPNKEKVFELFPRLKERRKQLAGTMSGGEQQMLAMGRALMSNASMLMLDEPSMGLSPLLVQEIFDIIRNIHAVAFEPQGRLDVVFRQGDVEIGIVVVGEGVVVAAGHLHRQVEVGYAARTAEHEVFEQMREPRAFGIFVACACFIEDVYRGELRDRVAVDDDRESVRQYFLFVFDHMAAKIVKKRRQE